MLLRFRSCFSQQLPFPMDPFYTPLFALGRFSSRQHLLSATSSRQYGAVVPEVVSEDPGCQFLKSGPDCKDVYCLPPKSTGTSLRSVGPRNRLRGMTRPIMMSLESKTPNIHLQTCISGTRHPLAWPISAVCGSAGPRRISCFSAPGALRLGTTKDRYLSAGTPQRRHVASCRRRRA